MTLKRIIKFLLTTILVCGLFLVAAVAGYWLYNTSGGEGLDVRSGLNVVTDKIPLNQARPSDFSGSKESGNNRDILLVTIDTLRADHLSSYGYPKPTSPFIDTLAERGIKFTKAYAPTSVTAPSHASIFTALYPIQHQIRKNGQGMSERFTTLTEILRDQGYRTVATVSTESHFGPSNIDQGFDVYDDPSPEEKRFRSSYTDGFIDLPYRPADRTARRAVRAIESTPDTRSLFLWVHFFDPHSPYAQRRQELASVLFDDQQRRDRWMDYVREQRGVDLTERSDRVTAYRLYDSEIRHVDKVLEWTYKRFRNVRGERPFTVLTADHGEGMGNHGYWAHDMHVYNEQVNVPLIIDWPGHRIDTSPVTTAVELNDLSPTVLRYAGVDSKTIGKVRNFPMQGSPLQPLVSGRQTERFGHAFVQRRTYEHVGWWRWLRIVYLNMTTDPVNYPFNGRAAASYEPGERYGLIDDGSKYHYQTVLPDEFYDLDGDFYEGTNRLSSRSDTAARLGGELKGIVDTYRHKDYPDGFRVNESTRENLKGLGYVN